MFVLKKLKYFLAAIFAVAAFCAGAAPKGPYKAQAAVFYFVHNGGPLKIGANLNFTKTAVSSINEGAAVVKILDAEENEEVVKPKTTKKASSTTKKTSEAKKTTKKDI